MLQKCYEKHSYFLRKWLFTIKKISQFRYLKNYGSKIFFFLMSYGIGICSIAT